MAKNIKTAGIRNDFDSWRALNASRAILVFPAKSLESRQMAKGTLRPGWHGADGGEEIKGSERQIRSRTLSDPQRIR
jgi:hypothetical protein